MVHFHQKSIAVLLKWIHPKLLLLVPGNANAVAAAALENKDLPFLVAELGSNSHQSNNNNNSDGDDRQFYPLLPFNHSSLKDKSWTINKMNTEMGAAV